MGMRFTGFSILHKLPGAFVRTIASLAIRLSPCSLGSRIDDLPDNHRERRL